MPSDWAKNKGGAVPGFANSVRRVMQHSEFAPTFIRSNFQYSGWKVTGSMGGESVFVTWRPADDTPQVEALATREEWLSEYVPVLEKAGYVVERSNSGLIVSKPRRVWTEVTHTRTGELVGWLADGEFRDISKGKPAD